MTTEEMLVSLVENEKEMALIRINMMESEIRRIKEKLA